MSRLVTLKDIAQRASVSVASVSKALAGSEEISVETRDSIRRISAELNYRPLRRRRPRAASGASSIRLALVFVSQDAHVHDSMALLHSLTRAGLAHDIKLEVTAVRETDPQRQIAHVRHATDETDGALLYGPVEPSVLAEASAPNRPCILMGNLGGHALHSPPPHSHVVTFDNITMARLSTRTLLAAGHQRVAILYAAAPIGFWFDSWLRGYRYAHLDAGIPLDPALDIHVGRGPDIGQRTADAVLALSAQPTAFVIPNAKTAAEFLARMQEMGRTIDPRNIIVGSVMSEAREYGVQHCPLCMIDYDAFAVAGLQVAAQAVQNPTAGGTITYVPFQLHNWPDAIPDTSAQSPAPDPFASVRTFALHTSRSQP